LSAFGGFVFGVFGFVSDFEFRISDFLWLLIYSQSQEVQKKCSKTVNFLQFLLKTRSFLTKNAKKCKFLLIFTPNFSPKTHKSYKITLFTTINHPIFQKNRQKPYISPYFPTFFLLPFSFSICSL